MFETLAAIGTEKGGKKGWIERRKEGRPGNLALFEFAQDKDKSREHIPLQRATSWKNTMKHCTSPVHLHSSKTSATGLILRCTVEKNCHPKMRLQHCLRAECRLCKCIHNYTIDHRITRGSDSCRLNSKKKNQTKKEEEGESAGRRRQGGSVKPGRVWTGSGGGIPIVYRTQGAPKTASSEDG